MQYHLNEAILELPPKLKDKTVQMFTLSDDGINEFNLVISRVQISDQETLENFAKRTLDELQARPGFELKHLTNRVVDGVEATEIAYKWRKDDVHLHQTQVAVLVQSPVPGQQQVLLFTATCLKASDDAWNEAFNRILDNARLRHPLSAAPIAVPHEAAAEAGLTAPSAVSASPAHVFALSVRKQVLQVYRDEDHACASVNALEVEDGLWLFYASDGRLATAIFTAPNKGRIWRSAGKYRLRTTEAFGAPTLREGLDLVLRIEGIPPFETLDAVQAHLEQQTLPGTDVT